MLICPVKQARETCIAMQTLPCKIFFHISKSPLKQIFFKEELEGDSLVNLTEGYIFLYHNAGTIGHILIAMSRSLERIITEMLIKGVGFFSA